MSWNTETVEILRVLINDLEETPEFTDERLERILIVAAKHVAQEMTFSQTFTVDVTNASITPDPTDSASKDDSLVNLSCLKAACIMDRGSAVTSAKNALIIREGFSSVDLSKAAQARLALLSKGYCAEYEEQKLLYQAGLVRTAGAAVMGPIRIAAMDLYNSNYYYNNNYGY